MIEKYRPAENEICRLSPIFIHESAVIFFRVYIELTVKFAELKGSGKETKTQMAILPCFHTFIPTIKALNQVLQEYELYPGCLFDEDPNVLLSNIEEHLHKGTGTKIKNNL